MHTNTIQTETTIARPSNGKTTSTDLSKSELTDAGTATKKGVGASPRTWRDVETETERRLREKKEDRTAAEGPRAMEAALHSLVFAFRVACSTRNRLQIMLNEYELFLSQDEKDAPGRDPGPFLEIEKLADSLRCQLDETIVSNPDVAALRRAIFKLTAEVF